MVRGMLGLAKYNIRFRLRNGFSKAVDIGSPAACWREPCRRSRSSLEMYHRVITAVNSPLGFVLEWHALRCLLTICEIRKKLVEKILFDYTNQFL